MSCGGDKPQPPRCVLGRVIEDEHDVAEIKRRLFHSERHLWVDLDDEGLTAEQRNSALFLGRLIYGEKL